MKTKPSIYRVLVLLGFSAVSSIQAATTYYVNSTNGADGPTRNGTTQPWLTVAYAATRVTTAGDSISVGPGTFSEAAVINLAIGVNLIGSGYTSTTITTSATGTNTVPHLLKLNTGGLVSGNQTVANIKFDGKSKTVSQGIETNRSNVTIHDVWMQDFYMRAVCAYSNTFPAGATWPVVPDDSYYLANLQIYNSTFLNSALVTPNEGYGYGTLTLSKLRDSSIHHCTVDESAGGAFNIKVLSWAKRLKIHNCSLVQADQWADSSRGKGFGIEIWNGVNCDFFDNWTNGGISFLLNDSKVHHNSIIMASGEGTTEGVEVSGDNTIVSGNYLEGATPGMAAWHEKPTDNLQIYHNVFRQCGHGILISNHGTGGAGNMKVYNNTFDLCDQLWNTSEGALTARVQDVTASMSNVQIKNNIFSSPVGISGIALTGKNGQATYVNRIQSTTITNNLFYNTTGGDVRDLGATGTTIAGSVNANPTYLGGNVPSPYYRLGTGSQAIGSGVNVGLPFLGSAPDRGAFVQDRTANATIEAEMNYSVPFGADVGTNGAIAVGNRNLDSVSSINMYDPGDTIRVHFEVATDGNYTIRARVRCGTSGNSTYYWPNGYDFKVDSVSPITMTGDAATISAYDSAGGGCYWGTMSGSGYLTAGRHHLEIKAAKSWGMFDYIKVE